MNAAFLYDHQQGTRTPCVSGVAIGTIDLVVDFGDCAQDDVSALLGVQHFAFPYGDSSDRCEAIAVAHEAAAKLCDAFGLQVCDFCHLPLRHAVNVSGSRVDMPPTAAGGNWSRERARQLAIVNDAACSPGQVVDWLL